MQAAQTLLGLKDNEGKCRVNVNAKCSNGYTPLQMDLEEDDKFDMYDLLLRHGADVNVQAEKDFAPIHFAAQNGAIRILQILIDSQKCNIDIAAAGGMTALNLATSFDHDFCVKFLLQNKANPFCMQDGDETCLHTAVRSGSIKSMDELFPYSYRIINAPNNRGFSPLHTAVMNTGDTSEQLLTNKRACAQLLINKGAAIEVRTRVGDTPLHYAASNDNVPCIELLVNSGACIDVRSNKEAIVKNIHVGGYAPLHYAAMLGKMGAVKKLVELGADVRAKTTLGKTALELAYDFKQQEVGTYLAERM
jgi:ankyrin repeat protein